MYNDPRMVVREYVQNAADAIDTAHATGELKEEAGCIQVDIDGKARTLCVEDNGTGVSEKSIRQVLCSIGCSTKTQGHSRGFRGIGRLGGLGYCSSLLFETRADASNVVSIIRWDARKVGEYLASGRGLHIPDLLSAAVQVRKRQAGKDDPNHFFRVTMCGVRRFHKDVLMDVTTTRAYLSQVAPVPHDGDSFSFSDEIESYLKEVDGFRQYHMLCNGKSVLRPHSTNFHISGSVSDQIKNIELVELHSQTGETLGRGWFAESSFLGALPMATQMRGIRVRQGNIQVGDEYFLADIFTERRFATWHIGEIHLNYGVTPNARRDGFEHTAEYEKFLEQANLLGRHLSQVSRASSRKRGALKTKERHMQEIESFLRTPFFLCETHFDREHAAASKVLQKVVSQTKDEEDKRLQSFLAQLNAMRQNPSFLEDMLDHTSLRRRKAADILQDICTRMSALDRDGTTVRGLLREVLQPYLLSSSRHIDGS